MQPEKTSELSNKLLRVITKAQTEFITNTDPHQLFNSLLENLLSITDSEYGFIGEVLYEADGTIYLRTHAITNIAWNEETRKFYEENIPEGLEFRNLKTLFGVVLTQKEPVISNDPYNDPRAGGLPKGHPPLRAFMGLPFFSGKEFVGMVGVANRSGGYDESLIRFLNPLLSTCANIIQAFRMNRKRMAVEESLRQSETKKRTILETVANGIITINAQGTIQDFNTAAEKIFGYAASEVVGKKINMLMPEPYHSNHDQYISNYLQTGMKKIIGIGREVMAKRKDGTIFPADLAINEMCIGSEKMFVGVLTDITLRKQTERALIIAKEKAEEANRLKSDFLNMISHELRTPLAVILGNISLLTDPENMPDVGEIVEMTRDLEIEANILVKLINDLLDLSRIGAGKMRLHLEPLSAEAIVGDAVSAIGKIAKQKGITIHTAVSEMKINADPVRIRQILLNILDNAVKFTDAGSIDVRVFPNKLMAKFEIEDTGCGIREEDMVHIFDVFRQADSSSTRKASGTGLGLTITKHLVEMHSGEISVNSRLNQGSTFTFSVPQAEE